MCFFAPVTSYPVIGTSSPRTHSYQLSIFKEHVLRVALRFLLLRCVNRKAIMGQLPEPVKRFF